MKRSVNIICFSLIGLLIGFSGQLLAETCTEGNCTDGKGTLTYADGGTYTGEFKNGKFEGQGTRTFTTGASYVGTFKSGKFERQGTMTYPDGGVYVGEFREGKRDGQGKLTRPNAQEYNGEWKNNLPNGQGLEILPNGTKYVGEFSNGKYFGKGTMTFASGSIYTGEFRSGVREGRGTLTYANRNKYEGCFKNDLPDGQGTMIYADGSTYVGEFKNGQREGKGTMTYYDGRKYIGEFKNNLWDGKGMLTIPDGKVYVGEFKNGSFVETGARIRDVRKSIDPNILGIGGNALSMPIGRVLLVRKDSQYCAIKFIEAWAGETEEDNFAKYELYYQGDGTGDFSKNNVQFSKALLAERKYIPYISIFPRLGGYPAGPENKQIKCGPIKLAWNSFWCWVYFNEHTWISGDRGIELAPTKWTDISQVNVFDPRVKWYRYDEKRKHTFILIDEMWKDEESQK